MAPSIKVNVKETVLPLIQERQLPWTKLKGEMSDWGEGMAAFIMAEKLINLDHENCTLQNGSVFINGQEILFKSHHSKF